MKTLEQTLKNLANLDEPISAVTALYALSELDKTQIEQVKAVWNTLPADRRATTMQHLVDLGDDSFEVGCASLNRSYRRI